MASNLNKASGLWPFRGNRGANISGAGTLYAIANDASNTYAIGDVVAPSTSSDAFGTMYCTKWASSSVPLGVIVGIRPVDPGVSLQGPSLTLEQEYIGKSAGIRYVYVNDDPSIMMRIQADSTGQAQNDVGSNCNMTATADLSATLSQSAPYSNTVIDHGNVKGQGTSGSLAYPLQIVGILNTPDNIFGSTASTASPYIWMLVTWNQHFFGGAKSGTA